MPMNVLSIIHAAADWPRFENVIGEPISSVMISAISGDARHVGVGEALHGGDALLGRQPRPVTVVERGAGDADRAVDVGDRGFGDPADDLFGVGRDHVDHGLRRGVDPLATDVELLVHLHERTSAIFGWPAA